MYDAELELEAELEQLMAALEKSDLQSEAEEFAPADLIKGARDYAIVTNLISRGVRNENQLTDAVFFARHPERNGRRLSSTESPRIQEWIQIRDTVVRPTLERIGSVVSQPSQVAQPVQPLFLGVDTYGFDGNKFRDWAKAKAEASISFAFIRSNYGTFKDPIFKSEWAKIKSAGLTAGVYLFLRFPNPTADKQYGPCPPPEKQAQAVIDTIGNIGPGDYAPTLDVEFPGGRGVTGMSAQQCLDHVRAAWAVLKSYYGVAPIIYTSDRVWQEDLSNHAGQPLPAPDLVESPLWLAYYPFKKGPAVFDSRAARISPPVPRPWGDKTNWWFHQYQGDAVRLPGFATGNVDMNRFNALAKGASGDRVKWTQRRLGIAQSGIFDATMEAALGTFQRSQGLPVNPVVDPRTFAFLCWSNP